MNQLEAWTTTAVNLSEHADNPVHTDDGARRAGYSSAIVAGTTVYAYLTHPIYLAWGEDWLASGGGEVRFVAPVHAGDSVECVPFAGQVPGIEARVDGVAKARLDAWPSPARFVARAGRSLRPMEAEIVEAHSDYGLRVGDDIVDYSRRGLAHPTTWIALANRVFIANLVNGPWIHTRSRVHHRGIGEVGTVVRIEPVLVDTFGSPSGERAVVVVTISSRGGPLAVVEHEAIVRLG